MDYRAEYKSKLRTPAEAAKVVKSGDWVDFAVSLGFPTLVDKALAERKDELTDVKIRSYLVLSLYSAWNVTLRESTLPTIAGIAQDTRENSATRDFVTTSLWFTET